MRVAIEEKQGEREKYLDKTIKTLIIRKRRKDKKN